jgi:hypothetical protein
VKLSVTVLLDSQGKSIKEKSKVNNSFKKMLDKFYSKDYLLVGRTTGN